MAGALLLRVIPGPSGPVTLCTGLPVAGLRHSHPYLKSLAS